MGHSLAAAVGGGAGRGGAQRLRLIVRYSSERRTTLAILRIEQVSAAEKGLFWRYFQMYLREHSAFTGKTSADGIYDYPWFDHYWREPGRRWPLWAKIGDQVAAIAMVRIDDDNYYELAEFFVAAPFRRQRVGERFAREIFSRFEGNWKLNQVKANQPALRFWRQVLQGIGPYEEAPLIREDKVERVEQRLLIDESSDLSCRE